MTGSISPFFGDPKLGGALSGVSDQTNQKAPAGVSSVLWELSSPAERADLLKANAGLTPAQTGVAMAGVATAALPQAGAVSIDLAALLGAARGIGPYVAIFARFGVMAMPLMLSGDTPKPPAQEIKMGDISLVVTAPAAFKKIGDQGTTAQFFVDKPGLIHFGSGKRKLDVPVTVQNGQISFDIGALQRAYGKQLPPGILAMAARPAGVPAALQTNPTTLRTAMAGAPDPCRNASGPQHHIIPAELMTRHQSFFTKINFTLDQPANIIRLPGNRDQRQEMKDLCGQWRPLHAGRHTRDYGNAISEKLTNIERRLNSSQINQVQARNEVGRLMSEIRAELSISRHALVNDVSVSNFIRSLKF